jgi:16S rRNA (guanine527-N7)-methyltransferase
LRASKDGQPIPISSFEARRSRLAPQDDVHASKRQLGRMAKAATQKTSPILHADKAAALALTPVSRETEARLDRYVDLLLEWQAKTNLVAPSTLPNLWTRHIADSLQLPAIAPSAKVWADLGSGGGFPGVVLACALAEMPGAVIHLVERNAKKAAFLREALRVTGAPGTVHLADIGDSVDRITGPVDCVTARALAPLHQLIGFAAPLVRHGAKALLLKGQDVAAELTEATKYWNIKPRLHSSRTSGHGWIVELDRIEPRKPSTTADGVSA